MTDEYAAMFALQSDSVEVLGQTIPTIREWVISTVSITPRRRPWLA